MSHEDRHRSAAGHASPAPLMPDPDATGAEEPLPAGGAGSKSRETHEREAAFVRGHLRSGEPPSHACAPDVPGLPAEMLFTLLAENVREYAVFLMDRNGIVKCWGEGARLIKWWTRQQAEGSHLRLLYPDAGAEDGTAEAHLQNAAETGEYTGEGHRVRSDGSTFWAGVTLTALRDQNGTLVGFAKVTRDFTGRRAVEATLRRQGATAAEFQNIAEEANRLKSVFIASVSHEVRTPLTALLGYVELLAQEAGADERNRAHIARIKRSGRHLLEIITDVLDMSRAEAGRLPIAAAVHRLGPAIEEALSNVHGQVAARGVTLTNAVSGAAADLPYWGDEARVRQIVVNLLTNAIKFTNPGGRVTISGGTGETVTGAVLAGTGPWVYVRVEDTGRGIPAERLDRIFDAFEQAEAADQHQGTGLGLSISRRLARLMGGDITVHSEVGVGSSFTLWLPIAPSDPVPR